MRSHAVAAIAAKRVRVIATPSELLRHVSADAEASSHIIHVHFR